MSDQRCGATKSVVGFACPDTTIACEQHDAATGMHFNRSHCRTGHSWFDPPTSYELHERVEVFLAAAGQTSDVEIFVRDGVSYYEKLLRSAPDLVRELAARVTDLESERDELGDTVALVRNLATEWVTQSNDYDEDTEQQIADGRTLLGILDGA